MSNVEVAKPTQVYSASITIAVAAASGTRVSTATNQLFAGVSNILGYTITSGANPGTLALALTASAGVSTITATTSANVAGVDLVIQVYWSNNAPSGMILG
jgi:hypothetical protein